MKREDGKREDVTRGGAFRRIVILVLTFHVFTLQPSGGVATAAPTQEDVFKSIKENVGNTRTDYSKLLPFALAAAGFVILLAVLSQRRKQERVPKPLNHQGKLVKEVLKTVPLRPSELKQLRILAQEGREEPLQSPLTLVLCPSLLAQAIQERQAAAGKGKARLDQKALLQLALKAGLVTVRKQK